MKWIFLLMSLKFAGIAFSQLPKGEFLIYEDQNIRFTYIQDLGCDQDNATSYFVKILNKQSADVSVQYKIKPEFNGKCFNCMNTLDPSLKEPISIPANGFVIGNCKSKDFGLKFSFLKGVSLTNISLTNLIIH